MGAENYHITYQRHSLSPSTAIIFPGDAPEVTEILLRRRTVDARSIIRWFLRNDENVLSRSLSPRENP